MESRKRKSRKRYVHYTCIYLSMYTHYIYMFYDNMTIMDEIYIHIFIKV